MRQSSTKADEQNRIELVYDHEVACSGGGVTEAKAQM
jgi:hypothetical protein